MREHLEPEYSDYEGLTESDIGPWYKQLWVSLSRLDGCKFGIGAILTLAIYNNTPTVGALAIVTIGALAIVDEFRKPKYYAENRKNYKTVEAEP